jgi:tellurite resistance protein
MSAVDDNLLSRVAKRLSEPPRLAQGQDPRAMLVRLATAFSSGSQLLEDEITRPTGFNPFAAALFEAVLESAFLVANADGHFDDQEQNAFVHVVVEACGGEVSQAQLQGLLADLAEQLLEDGADKRVEMVGRTITRPEHGEEVLRIAGLLAHASAGVSDVEMALLEKLAARFGLPDGTLNRVLAEVQAVMSA